MPARTGKQFLEGMRKPRAIWVDGDRVSDAASHPALSGAAHALAEIFDLQHVEKAACLMPDPETGEPIAVSHMIPRSREDLAKRGRALRTVSEYSVGLMGRTPDYMNVTYAAAGRPDEWGAHGNEAGAERLVAYQKFLRRGDIALTHTIVQPTVDKAAGDAPVAGNEHALRKVGETGDFGIVVRGARRAGDPAGAVRRRDRRLSRRAVAARLGCLCALVLHPDGRAGAEVPVRAATACRAAATVSTIRCRARFDEQDAFVIFDDVEVPRDRLFIDCNLKWPRPSMAVSTRRSPPGCTRSAGSR